MSAQSQAADAREAKRDEARDELGKGVQALEKTVARLEEKITHIETALVELKAAIQSQRVPTATWLSAASIMLVLIGMLSAALWVPLQTRVADLEKRASGLEAADAKSQAEREELRREIDRTRETFRGK